VTCALAAYASHVTTQRPQSSRRGLSTAPKTLASKADTRWCPGLRPAQVRGRREEATAIVAALAAGNRRAMPSEPLAVPGEDEPAGTDAATVSAAEQGGVSLVAASGAAAAEPGAGGAEETKPLASGAAAPPAKAEGGKPEGLFAILRRDRRLLRRFVVLSYVWLVVGRGGSCSLRRLRAWAAAAAALARPAHPAAAAEGGSFND
jgi:hypothetical protein